MLHPNTVTVKRQNTRRSSCSVAVVRLLERPNFADPFVHVCPLQALLQLRPIILLECGLSVLQPARCLLNILPVSSLHPVARKKAGVIKPFRDGWTFFNPSVSESDASRREGGTDSNARQDERESAKRNLPTRRRPVPMRVSLYHPQMVDGVWRRRQDEELFGALCSPGCVCERRVCAVRKTTSGGECSLPRLSRLPGL